MNRRTQLAQRAAIVLVVVVAGVLFVRSRHQEPPKEAIRNDIETFVEHLEYGRISKAIKMLDPAFTFNGYDRGDISRGLAMNRRDTGNLDITLLDLRVTVDELTHQGVAEMDVTLSFFRGGREIVIGAEKPIPVRVVYQQQGRDWVAVRGEGDPEIEALGYAY